jgi:diguanylate cyclase (GGDEF)-like protein
VTADGDASDAPRPGVSLRDAEKIVRRLAPALHSHGLWVQRIHAILICRLPPAAVDLSPDSHRMTELGRWLEQDDGAFLRQRPEFAAALAGYRQMHARARALCREIADLKAIAPADYEAFCTALTDFDRSMEALVRQLWDLLRNTDPLTGIATRFALLPRLDEERDRLRRTGHTCCVCMVDLDHFKEINDRHGHAAGDAVLEAVSAFLFDNLRRYDQVCRYGGEEFVLMLPDTEPAEAMPIIDRLRRGLAELAIVLDDGTRLRITASFGIAPLTANQTVADSIAHADQAMYAAKRAGRNQVLVWHEL